jgi:ABC-type multidrug transport system fused ATPase/permease subunit
VTKYLFIVRTLKLLIAHSPVRLLFIFFITLLHGITSGFSIVLLIPLLQLLNINGGDPDNGLARFFRDIADKTGISLNIGTILMVYIILLALGAFLQYWKSLLDAEYQQTFIYQLRRRLFRKIILADWPLLNRKSKTSHIQILTKEVPNLAVYYIYYLRLLTALLMTSSYIIYSMIVSAKFTLIIIITGILLFIFLHRYLFKAFNLGEAFVESYSRLYKYINDFWQSVKIAKVHSSEQFYYDKFDEASNSLLNMEYRIERNWLLPQLIYRTTGILILAAVVYLGYNSHQVNITSFFILIILFSRIFPQFVAITGDVNMLFTNAGSVEMVLKLDEEFPDNRFNEIAERDCIVPEKEIRLENMDFVWPDGEKLFENFSGVINANSITGIIGESGRGKTTLIDLIAGLQKPDSGRIKVDGKLLDDALLPAWKSPIGYLPQDPFFIDGTLRENLIWDSRNEITDEEILQVLEQVNASHLVNRFYNGLDAFIVNYQINFSGGECQRLALARVLLRKPGVLLLDEATSSLDAENEVLIMEVIKRLKEKVTIIFITHRISLLPWFDKVIKL